MARPATLACLLGILALFVLARNRRMHTSKALWIPVAWLLIAGSRPVSEWASAGPAAGPLDQVNVEANPLNVVVFSILLTAGFMVLIARRREVLKLVGANWLVLLFFSYCLLSTLWSDFPGAAFRKWIRSLGDPVMVLILLTDANPMAALQRLLARAGFLLLPLSVLLIKYYPALGRAYNNSWEPMYTGVTDNKNTLGMICLVVGIGFTWRLFEHYRAKGEAGRGRFLFADGAILAMILWLLRMAHSVTSACCLAMGAVLLAVTQRSAQRQKLGVLHLLVAVLLSIPVFALFFDSGGGLVESLGRNPTLTGRTEIWRQVLGMARNPLVGTGFESFWLGDRFREMSDNNPNATLNEAHNGYIEIYLNLGWCGVTLVAALIVTGYRKVMAAVRRDPCAGGLRLAYFVAAVSYSLTEAGFRMLVPVWIFFLWATICVPKRRPIPSGIAAYGEAV